MNRPPAFVTKRLPVLYTIHPIVRSPGLPTLVTVDIAVVIRGIPSVLASHTVPEDRLDSLVASLQSGDVRVSVTGIAGNPADGAPPMAYVGVVCSDGRRVPLCRVRGEASQSSEDLAWSLRERVENGDPLRGEAVDYEEGVDPPRTEP